MKLKVCLSDGHDIVIEEAANNEYDITFFHTELNVEYSITCRFAELVNLRNILNGVISKEQPNHEETKAI